MIRLIRVIRVHLNKNMYTHMNITTLENDIDKTLSLLEATVTWRKYVLFINS